MSDEQATKMIELLTEIRDELRLVRDTVVPAKDHVTMMKTLWDTTETFDLAHTMMSRLQVQPINAVASQRVPVPETP